MPDTATPSSPSEPASGTETRYPHGGLARLLFTYDEPRPAARETRQVEGSLQGAATAGRGNAPDIRGVAGAASGDVAAGKGRRGRRAGLVPGLSRLGSSRGQR